MLELSCLSNRGGRFLDILEYHSGAHRGSIWLPKGRRGAGWSLFEFQVRKYFLCEIVVPKQRVESPRMTEEKLSAVGISGIRNASWNQNQQGHNSRLFQKNARSAHQPSKPVTIPVKEKRESRTRADMAINSPRPTRLSHFVWKPKSRTLRITVDLGSRRVVEWIGLESSNGPKIIPEEWFSGPLVSEAQQPNILHKGVVEGPIDTNKTSFKQFCVGEASGTKEKLTESTPSDDEDSEPEIPVVPSFVGSDGFSDASSFDSNEDNLRREPSCLAVSPSVGVDLMKDERVVVSDFEPLLVVLKGGDEISLPMVLCSLDNEHMTTGASMSEAGCLQMESLSASYILEDT